MPSTIEIATFYDCRLQVFWLLGLLEERAQNMISLAETPTEQWSITRHEISIKR